MNSRGEGRKTESVEAPQGSHTVKEAERGSRLTVAFVVIATHQGQHGHNPAARLQIWLTSPKRGLSLVTGQR